MRKIYLIRHGLTNSDAEGLVQTAESELSEEGIKQAKAVARRFEHIEFQHLFSSDYKRAFQTAEEVGKISEVEIEKTELLREMRRPTKFQNHPSSSAEYQAFLAEANENVTDKNWRVGDGENFFDVVERIKEFFVKLESIEGDCVLITHARMIKLITLFTIMQKEPEPLVWRLTMNSMLTTNTGITTLVYNEKHKQWQLETFNDQAHFAE